MKSNIAELFIINEVLRSTFYNFDYNTYFMRTQKHTTDILMRVVRDVGGLSKLGFIHCTLSNINNLLSGNITEIQINQESVWGVLQNIYGMSDDEIKKQFALIIYNSDDPKIINLFNKHIFNPLFIPQ